MIHIFIINELTVLRFLVLILFGHPPYVLAVDPLLPPLRGLFDRFVRWSVGGGRARWIIDLCPDQRHLWEYPTRTFLYDVFGQTEAWHNAHFGFEAADAAAPAYARAYKHLTCGYAKPRHYWILLLGAALDNMAGRPVRIIGLDDDTLGLLRAYRGGDFAPDVKAAWVPRRLFNAVVFLAVQAYSLIWVLTRVRPAAPKPEAIFFAADYYDDPRDFRLYHEVADGGPVLLVVRNSEQRIESFPELASYHRCNPEDGLFGPAEGTKSAAMVITDGWRLFRHFHRTAPSLFYQISALPYRRAMLRALFNRYRPKFFWGRDDYNVAHILRRQELRRVGGVSLGISHGYSVSTNRYAVWRYIDFDRYYTQGRAVYERYLKDTWPADMEVVSVGTFGASRDDYRTATAPKPPDIVVFTAMALRDDGLVAFVRDLAQALPERQILLQVKSTFVESAAARRFVDMCTRGLSNVQLTDAPVFDLFKRARYAFSDPSTVVVEALQFGLMSFMIDILPYHKTCIFREFPGLCVTSGKQAAGRIRDIESGRVAYGRDRYRDLVELSGHTIFDIVRSDLGLPATMATGDNANETRNRAHS